MKAHNKHSVGVFKPYLIVIACLLIALYWKLKFCCLFFLFLIWLRNWGCNLSMGAAYTVHGLLQYIDFKLFNACEIA